MNAAGSHCFLAEWYADDGADGVARILDRLKATLSGESAPGAARLVLTLAVPTDEVVFGVFEAASIETVDAACHQAGLPPLRINPVLRALDSPESTRRVSG